MTRRMLYKCIVIVVERHIMRNVLKYIYFGYTYGWMAHRIIFLIFSDLGETWLGHVEDCWVGSHFRHTNIYYGIFFDHFRRTMIQTSGSKTWPWQATEGRDSTVCWISCISCWVQTNKCQLKLCWSWGLLSISEEHLAQIIWRQDGSSPRPSCLLRMQRLWHNSPPLRVSVRSLVFASRSRVVYFE